MFDALHFGISLHYAHDYF